MRRFLASGVSIGAPVLLLVGCSPSESALEEQAEDLPGVVSVVAVENDGDDGIPFAPIAKQVSVTMRDDATTAEVTDALDAYDEAIDDGDVGGVELVLQGSKHATLSVGEGIHATEEVVADLVAAQGDATITEYRREAHPVLPSVHVTLARGGFREVVTVADRYLEVVDVESVTVIAGAFLLIRDEVNEDLRLTAAREELVLAVAERFRLRGALVSGRGPVRLAVSRADEAAVRAFVARRSKGSRIGKVVVGQSAEPPV